MEQWMFLPLGFFSGSVMYSYLIGRFAIGADIRTYGDGNPGSANVFRSGHLALGILSMLLDFGKGFLPVVAFRSFFPHEPVWLVLVSVAPVLGHAFSPWMKGKGGKAVAVTFGIWSGLTLWQVPCLLGGCFILFMKGIIFEPDGWKVIMGMLVVLVFLLFALPSVSFFVIWVANFSILVYKHRADIKQGFRVRFGFSLRSKR